MSNASRNCHGVLTSLAWWLSREFLFSMTNNQATAVLEVATEQLQQQQQQYQLDCVAIPQTSERIQILKLLFMLSSDRD